MARERMVTRTITEVVATCMTVNPTTATIENKSLLISGANETTTTAELLKLAKKQYETTDCVIVSVIDVAINVQLYGMTEVDFLKYAKKLENR